MIRQKVIDNYRDMVASLKTELKLAEAEVERLQKVYSITNESWQKIQAENAKLRKVADIAWNVVETKGLSDVLLNELAGRLADWETWKEGER